MSSLIPNLGALEFKEILRSDPDAILVDVRSELEFISGHIPKSVNLNISSPQFLAALERLDRTKQYCLYCRSGSRSFIAGTYMMKMGFEKVCHLAPGIIAWRDPLEKGEPASSPPTGGM